MKRAEAKDYWIKMADVDFDATGKGTESEVPMEKKFYGPDGEEVTEHEFKGLVHHGCAMCASPIPVTPEESSKIGWVYWNEPLCDGCTEAYSKKACKNGTSMEDEVYKEVEQCN